MSDKIIVKVSLSGDAVKPKINFESEVVTVVNPDSKVVYVLEPQASLGYVFSGVIFPKDEQKPVSIVSDIRSFKIKDDGYQLIIKDSNVNAGTIGLCLLFNSGDLNVVVSSDPQVKNDPPN